MRTRIILSFAACLIVAVIAGCSSSTSDDISIDLTPPPQPVGLSFLDNRINNGAAYLTWNPVSASDLSGYNVYWLGDSEIDTTSANRMFSPSNQATITGLDYETLYYFGVTAIDKSGNESGLSALINGRPQNNTGPLAPTGIDIVAENIDFPLITIFWESNTEPDLGHYNVYRALSIESLNDTTSFIASVTKESFIDINIEIDTPYYYRVTAVDKAGWESNPSQYVQDYSLSQVNLESPINFSYVSKKPTLSWTPVEGAVNYNIIVTTSRIGGEIWNHIVDGTQYTIEYSGKSLISGNTYYWKVGAISKTEINSVSDIGSFVVSVP